MHPHEPGFPSGEAGFVYFGKGSQPAITVSTAR